MGHWRAASKLLQAMCHYELATSQVVLEEARAGDSDAAQRHIAVLTTLFLLDVTAAVIQLATTLIIQCVLPAQAMTDAFHRVLVPAGQARPLWNKTL